MKYLKQNRAKLTFFTILIALCIIFIDNRFFHGPDHLVQWITLITSTAFVFYLQFYITINDEVDIVEATESHFKKDIEETIEFENPVIIDENTVVDIKTPYEICEPTENTNLEGENFVAENLYLNTHINSKNQNTMAKKPGDTADKNPAKSIRNAEQDSKKQATDASPEGTESDGKAPVIEPDITVNVTEIDANCVFVNEPKTPPINGYNLSMVHSKYRGMYREVCDFALHNGQHKTTELLRAKMVPYGHPFQTIKNGPELVAFKTGFIRIPLTGWFGVTE